MGGLKQILSGKERKWWIDIFSTRITLDVVSLHLDIIKPARSTMTQTQEP